MAEVLPAALPRMVWSVSALLRAVGDTLANRFSACTVQGELSGFSRASSGHCYFSLKDADGQPMLIRCAMFRRAAALLDFAPAEGQRVELRGRVGVYEPRGELQFIVEAMQCVGDGSLYEQFLRLKAKLEAEGLFDASRKRPLPRFPRRIGIVTSLAAAALHDVLASLARRAPHLDVIVYPSAVQGADAPQALVAALALAARRAEADTLLLCRGGGSLEDLWAFNDERVVRAIAASPIPLVCGVGHETDVSLADFAADLRAPTPTAAAELAAPATADLLADLQRLHTRLRRRVQQRLQTEAQRLDHAGLRLARPAEALRGRQHQVRLLAHRLHAAVRGLPALQSQQLQQTARRLQQAAATGVLRQTHRLAQLATRLDGVDPKVVTRRGYTWLTDDTGRPIQRVAELALGQALRAVLADGEAGLAVTSVQPQPPQPEG